MRALSILAVVAVVVLVNLASWAVPNRPYAIEVAPGGTLSSVSFAPFRADENPLTGRYPSAAEIEEDLRLLKTHAGSVRTYSQQGLEPVVPLAARYGLTVTPGAWLSSDLALNDAEVRGLIEQANAYPDTVKRVIVGNEVLLRGELTPEQLKGYLRRVRAAIKQPVSYADVWEWWLKYPELADEVDFITIHLLPYWEDVPAGVDRAAAHILWAYGQIRERFPGKPVLIGETGWPSAGRTRGPAIPSVLAEARFLARVLAVAEENGFDYNIVEAFDQPWKAHLEGTVGAHWGLYTSNRQPKFPLAGPVVEDPGWPGGFAASTVLALAALGGIARRRPPLSLAGFAATCAMAQGLATALVHAVLVAARSYFTMADMGWAAALLALQAVLAAAILAATAATFGDGPTTGRAAGSRALPAILRQARSGGLSLSVVGKLSAVLLAAVAIVLSALLIVAGRYRNFPVPHFIVPAVGLLALAALRAAKSRAGIGGLALGSLLALPTAGDAPAVARLRPLQALARTPIEASLALGLVAGAIGIVAEEGLANREALWWALLQLALAVPFAATCLQALGGLRRPRIAATGASAA